ncbi:hypothetical protein QQG74_21615 [Micromonospora sp. FIMYZ51]|uniref:hypothetical protein n=1 Tax=Micromonospora sp. FIMYZ51 TaxID=3051832 RepID=UPI00311FBDE7
MTANLPTGVSRGLNLTEAGCTVSPDWRDAMAQGLSAVRALDTPVIATDDFVRTVSDLLGSDSYHADRGGGVVAAKTLHGPNGPTIVVNYTAVAGESTALVERLLAHEGGHVLLNRRGNEELGGHRKNAESDWEWMLKCVAGLAIIEFRIELMLAELGYPPAPSATVDSIDEHLGVTNAETFAAIVNPANQEPAHLRDSIMSIMDHSTKLLAYVAAPHIAGTAKFDPDALPADGKEDWADYFASTWPKRLRLWGSIPPADQPVPVDAWRNKLRKGAALEVQQLRDFGFAFTTHRDGGEAFNRIARDEVFHQRLERAQRRWPTS